VPDDPDDIVELTDDVIVELTPVVALALVPVAPTVDDTTVPVDFNCSAVLEEII